MRYVLFLCTGNYYRSRFAEHLFNHMAAREGLPWRADSCGLRVRPDGVVNSGPISRHAVAGMAAREIEPGELRYPRQVTEADLERASILISLKEAEHRVMFEALYPADASRMRYWHIHDVDAAVPEEALRELEGKVRELIGELQ